ncbi:hypothetical protein BJV78DRAFT_1161173 [Lactifluus subvellereus]|nr:hypothetical protein BJV78DRAFT_1161173 [Lactifluus subvellereus]
MASNPNQPPVPFTDFEFSFDPALNALFPPPPPLPPSAGLFSDSETTDIFGFLDNFNWEFDPPPPHSDSQQEQPPTFRYDPSSSTQLPSPLQPSQQQPQQQEQHPPPRLPTPSVSAASRNKHLLSSPQKRLNHIMSEQKRRNAIREGYAQLTTLLAPKGAPPGTGMPTRGRPKGSGSRGKGRTKGKSGVLFRAVEYCHWLEEGIEALREEVRMVEAAAGIRAG